MQNSPPEGPSSPATTSSDPAGTKTAATMMNRRMAEMLASGECLDVRLEGEQVTPGMYRLRRFVDGVDYCDAEKEAWIWSIGSDITTGEIYASTTSCFYQNADYKCLFLR